ncbi:polysaccharide pyruvyl transferase family protein [Tenacibaculum singaporense]|uniref:polysaccharide pyruvyl transferase family protein n=1 Tax=Tenacibaculum singaporense TaxID=2358479 RepID=UPI000F66BD2E|nr:polysaccharide pyruvyl transferase family protein [Tenacibaculum singaporense]RSC92988.1 polysaccharide pyruvyl transferase family protein [Tenacibaculum singaporense]
MSKNALLDYKDTGGYFNIGDYVQSIAAKQYFSNIDLLLNREYLNDKNIEPCKLIMNGWFMYKTKNWPISPNIDPLFVSFHLNAHIADTLLSRQENITYLKQYEPIGCRDFYTVNILKKYGVDSYYSSCLTTTLPKIEAPKTDDIVFFDVLFNLDKKSYYERIPRHYYRDLIKFKLPKFQDHKEYLKSIFPEEIVNNAKFETAFYKEKGTTSEDRFKEAERLLKTFASAKLVITSRIHCALPCLAMGTPVIFIMGGLNNSSDLSRLDGIVQHFNMVNLDSELDLSSLKNLNLIKLDEINWEEPIPNPTNHLQYTQHLIDRCTDFTKN